MKSEKLKNSSIFTGLIIILILIISYLLQSCTPVRYVYVDPKDSVVRHQRIIRDYQYIQTPMYMDWYYRPFYSPRIVVPIRPIQRPGHGPLPPTPRPKR